LSHLGSRQNFSGDTTIAIDFNDPKYLREKSSVAGGCQHLRTRTSMPLRPPPADVVAPEYAKLTTWTGRRIFWASHFDPLMETAKVRQFENHD